MLNKMTGSQQPFSKINFWLIGGCCLLIIIGFLLMLGGGSSIEGGFNPDIFSTRRIVIGPLLAFLGFLFMAFAIFFNPNWLKKFIGGKKNDRHGTNVSQIKVPSDNEATKFNPDINLRPEENKTEK